MGIIDLVNRGCKGLVSTTEIDVLFLERSWAGLVGLDATGCGTLTGSTTTGTKLGVTGCETLTGSTTTDAGSKSDDVSKVEAGQRSRLCSEELARVFTA